jgi:glycosyltransferase involved in cell wall biosynthesis
MISIITPTFNRRDLVQTTIKSIIGQKFTDWELIVVDDGSTDDTEEVLKTYLTDPRIRYIKKQNTGQADSLNVGVSHSKGEFIVFLDSDDEAYPDWLETVNPELRKNTGILSVGAIRKLIDGTMIDEGIDWVEFSGEKIRVKFTCGSLFIRRKVFDAIGGYDSSLKANIQTDLGLRLITHIKKHGLEIATIDKNLVQINIHGGPRIRTNWKKKSEGGIQFLEKHYNFISKHNPKEIANICATIAYSNYKLHNRKQSVHYILKAIKHNPYRWYNYLRAVKYALM